MTIEDRVLARFAARLKFPNTKPPPSPAFIATLAEAFKLGQAAFEGGLKCIPHHDLAMAKLIGHVKPQTGEILPMLDAWLEGWHGANLRAPY